MGYVIIARLHGFWLLGVLYLEEFEAGNLWEAACRNFNATTVLGSGHALPPK